MTDIYREVKLRVDLGFIKESKPLIAFLVLLGSSPDPVDLNH